MRTFSRLLACLLWLGLALEAFGAETSAGDALRKAILDLRAARERERDPSQSQNLSRAIAALEEILPATDIRLDRSVLPIATLDREYKDNPAAADRKYKGKTLAVSGVVHKIEKQITSEMYYLILTPAQVLIDRSECRFFFASDDDLAQLRPGMAVVIEGKCKGLDLYVVFTGCRVLHKPPLPAGP